MEKWEITAYTDGSAVSNGKKKGYGGYGACIVDEQTNVKSYYSEGFYPTKIGRMELMAVLKVIQVVSSDYNCPIKLIIYSDSEYVVKSFTEGRLAKWAANGWINTSGAVKNQDLWKQVIQILEKSKNIEFKIIHVKGHQIDKIPKEERKEYFKTHPIAYGNFIADMLADYKRHDNYKQDLN